MNAIDRQVHLEHYGVKGMRWGQRKLDRQSPMVSDKSTGITKDVKSGKVVSYKPTGPRSGRSAQGADFAKKIMSQAEKNPDDLYILNGQVMVTGKQFLDHMIAGGVLDIRTTQLAGVRED